MHGTCIVRPRIREFVVRPRTELRFQVIVSEPRHAHTRLALSPLLTDLQLEHLQQGETCTMSKLRLTDTTNTSQCLLCATVNRSSVARGILVNLRDSMHAAQRTQSWQEFDHVAFSRLQPNQAAKCGYSSGSRFTAPNSCDLGPQKIGLVESGSDTTAVNPSGKVDLVENCLVERRSRLKVSPSNLTFQS